MWFPSWNKTSFWQHLQNLRDTSHPTHTSYKQKKKILIATTNKTRYPDPRHPPSDPVLTHICGIDPTSESESSPGLKSTARFNVANGHAARATKREADRAYTRGFWGNVRIELYSRVDHRSLNTVTILGHIQRYQHDDERQVYPLCSIKQKKKSGISEPPWAVRRVRYVAHS